MRALEWSARLSAALCALVWLVGAARAQAQEPTRVALDWREVADADIERCGLSRLRAGTLERLVQDGYAVVERTDASGIAVYVSSREGGLHIQVASAGFAHEETLGLAAQCDATLVLDLISRLAELVAEARSRLPAPPALDAEAAPLERAPRPNFQLSGELAARMVGPAKYWLFGAGVAARARLAGHFELGARLELSANRREQVTLLESGLFASGLYFPRRGYLGLVVEAGPLLHVGRSATLTRREPDAVFALGVAFQVWHFAGQLLGSVRLRSFEHRIEGKVAFETSYVGMVLRLGMQLFEP